MWWTLVKATISAAVIVAVAELSHRFPRLGALLLTLPIVSILIFVMSWQQHQDLPAISRLARETLVPVPLGLPFLLSLAIADRPGWGFWSASAHGVILVAFTIGVWFVCESRAA